MLNKRKLRLFYRNNYKTAFLSITLFGFMLLLFGIIGNMESSNIKLPNLVIAPALSSSQQQILTNINNYRRVNGKLPLFTDVYTCSYATTRSQQIITDFSHDQFDLDTSNGLAYPFKGKAYENLSRGYSASTVVDMWISSPQHNLVLLSDMDYMCVDESLDSQGHIYTAFEGFDYE